MPFYKNTNVDKRLYKYGCNQYQLINKFMNKMSPCANHADEGGQLSGLVTKPRSRCSVDGHLSGGCPGATARVPFRLTAIIIGRLYDRKST